MSKSTIIISLLVILINAVIWIGLKKVSLLGTEQQQLLLNKDLMIDAAPPPLYVIEAFELMNQLEGMRPEVYNRSKNHIEELYSNFKKTIFKWENAEQNKTLINELDFLNKSTDDFFKFYNEKIISKIDRKTKIDITDYEELRSLFNVHKKSILNIIQILETENTNIQAKTSREIIFYGFLLFIICFITLFIFMRSKDKIIFLNPEIDIVGFVFIGTILIFISFEIFFSFLNNNNKEKTEIHWAQSLFVGFLCSIVSYWLLKRDRKISKKLIFLQESDRNKIAWDLHDGVAQILGSVSFRLKNLLSSNEISNQATRSDLNRTLELVTMSIQDIRRISHSMSPTIIDHLGLEAACIEILNDIKDTKTIKIEYQIDINESELKTDLKLGLFRILQEVVNNTLKHSQATSFRFILRSSKDEIYFLTEDNGLGFDLTKDFKFNSGIGLINIKERVKILNGKLNMKSQSGKGFIIEISFPLSRIDKRVPLIPI